MKLRTKLVALSLLTLLLPWSSWKLLQELEQFLREAQENALLASARTLAGALPVGFQTRLMFMPSLFIPLRSLRHEPALDGYVDDWPDPGQGLEFTSGDGELGVRLLAAQHRGQLYLLFDVSQEIPAGPAGADAGLPRTAELSLLARSPRGLFQFTVRPEAPGPLQSPSEGEESGQLEGYWRDTPSGFRVELLLPVSATASDVTFRISEPTAARQAGPMVDAAQPAWIDMTGAWQEASDWLSASEAAAERTWLLDSRGWVLAASGDDTLAAAPGSAPDSDRTTWLQRLVYRLVAGSRTQLQDEMYEQPVRLRGEAIRSALTGREAVSWGQDPESAVVWNTVAAPVALEGRVRGAIVMQSRSEGLLLATNRALGRLVLTTLALTLGLAAGLWFFASRLSQRVRRLSAAVSEAMADTANPEPVPLQGDGDELGDLARNNQKLLRAVADYSQYLQTLAGKLSHELKTPLAITRSSLDNLSNQALDGESRRFLDRAREGVERQAAIVRAMSEASRLEAAIGVAEWEEIDLCGLVNESVDAYRSIHAGRQLSAQVPGRPVLLDCAPDLLAQALDKLVDNAVSLSGEDDEVTVSLRDRESVCELTVRNTGSRLPEELSGRLFDSLVSLREKRGAAPNLGLGLYIVRLVAAAHGGEVSARNLDDGQGVEFMIRLPRAS
jgi:signal transduction histidine kinase